MSKERLFSAAFLIGLTILALMYEWACVLVLLALTVGGLYEFFYLLKKKGIPIYSYTGIFLGLVIPIATYVQFEPTKGWEMLFIAVVLLTVFFMQFLRNDVTDAIVGISTTLFGVIYVSWFFSFLVKIRFLMPGTEGLQLLAFILLVTKSGDVGALFVGSRFGKRPLVPKVSPKKTVEGSVGSFLFSVTTALLCRGFLPEQIGFTTLHVAFIGLFFGGLGQIGDMCESLIKRDLNVKDSGRTFPALGGVLDAIDSLLFSAPVFYYYISVLLKSTAYGS